MVDVLLSMDQACVAPSDAADRFREGLRARLSREDVQTVERALAGVCGHEIVAAFGQVRDIAHDLTAEMATA